MFVFVLHTKLVIAVLHPVVYPVCCGQPSPHAGRAEPSLGPEVQELAHSLVTSHTTHAWVADRARRPRRETQSTMSMAMRITHRRSSSAARIAGHHGIAAAAPPFTPIHRAPSKASREGWRRPQTPWPHNMIGMILLDASKLPPPTVRRCCPHRLLKTLSSSVLPRPAKTGEDLARHDGDAGRPRLDERHRLGAPSTAMCSAPTEAAAAAIAVGAKGKVADPALFLKLTVG